MAIKYEMTAGTWFYLRGSESAGQAQVTMAGQPATVPKSAVLERVRGLEVLRQAGDFSSLLSSHSWLEQ